MGLAIGIAIVTSSVGAVLNETIRTYYMSKRSNKSEDKSKQVEKTVETALNILRKESHEVSNGLKKFMDQSVLEMKENNLKTVQEVKKFNGELKGELVKSVQEMKENLEERMVKMEKISAKTEENSEKTAKWMEQFEKTMGRVERTILEENPPSLSILQAKIREKQREKERSQRNRKTDNPKKID